MTELLTAAASRYPCKVHGYHWPRPSRSVKHHIWPQEYGGPTVPDNLVWTCDTGHYNIHALLDAMLAGTPLLPHATREEKRLAGLGLSRIGRRAL